MKRNERRKEGMGIGEGWKTERKYERREAQRIWENGKKREKNEGREELGERNLGGMGKID